MNVVIVGANKGLGLTLVKVFAEKRHNVLAGVYGADDMKPVNSVADTYKQHVKLVNLNVADESSVRNAAKIAGNLYGRIDVLINVAGVLMRPDQEGTITETDIDVLRKTLEVNTVGTVMVLKYFLPFMSDGGSGMIISITSEAGSLSNTGTIFPAYSVSKAAANKAVFIFRAAVGDRYRIYAMHPGRMNTEMGRRFAQIEPEESARSIYKIATGETEIMDDGTGFINYKGEAMSI